GGFDPDILRTIITRESSWDKEAKGKAGEYGLTQIMPSTWRSLNKQMGVNWMDKDDWKDPEKNIAVASYFISTLVTKYGGNLLKVFGAYNRGEAEMDNFLTKGKDFSNSGRAYINGSLSLYNRLKKNN
ncbi:MAG TPA: transglycosylase SLT domain-containing protein, partial [Candidatus Dojkabacteria bacterium]|nr:transglycosylase SLT domain-containing protein [Candidatus Dojkabacteria bacterium]